MLKLFFDGGPWMWPLLACSFVSTVFVIERGFFFWNESRKRKPRHIQLIFQAAECGRLDRAEYLARKAGDDCIARTLLSGLSHRNYSLTQALETQAMLEAKRMKKHLTILDTVITAAPLLGILGTVTGIIQSFEAVSTQGNTNPMVVTAGIAAALITTAFGLTIALATVIPFNYFHSLYQGWAEELERTASLLEIILQKQPKSPHLQEELEISLEQSELPLEKKLRR